jgi:hypothetical protein
MSETNNTNGTSNRFLWWFTGAIGAPFLLATMGTFFGLSMNNAQRASALEAALQEVHRQLDSIERKLDHLTKWRLPSAGRLK